MRPPVFLTGATGFLGMEVLARLLERGDREVVALVRAGGVSSTVNVTGALWPPLPTASDCSARAVYVPPASASALSPKAPVTGSRLVVFVCIGDPAASVPAQIVTVTVAESPACVPAVPASSGVVSATVDPGAGWSSVTDGANVSTVQLRLAGLGSGAPEPSRARTSKLCGPSARPS